MLAAFVGVVALAIAGNVVVVSLFLRRIDTLVRAIKTDLPSEFIQAEAVAVTGRRVPRKPKNPPEVTVNFNDESPVRVMGL